MSETNTTWTVDTASCYTGNQGYTVTRSDEPKKKSIGVFWSNRSEEGLLKPVIAELKKHFEVVEYKVPDKAEDALAYMLTLDTPLPDAAIVPYDRPPMTLMAWLCFHNGIPVIQLHAGDISSGTWDDQDRWAITNWSSYWFCAGRTQVKRVRKFLRAIGREGEREHVYLSGVTNLDDIDKMSEPPDGDYDVVLYNPPTKFPEKISDEVTEIFNLLDKETYWICPNGDPGSEFITQKVKDLMSTVPPGSPKVINWAPTMPHESMLGLFSRAKRAIGNSSSLFFEAPYFGCEIIQVGARNKIREPVELKPGGSKVIARKLRKCLR